MVLPYTSYQVLKPVPVVVSTERSGSGNPVIELPEGTTFRISLCNNPGGNEVKILLPNAYISSSKALQQLLPTGYEQLSISISKELLQHSCCMSSDFSQAIYFYTVQDKYGAFSNFSPHGLELDGLYFATVEHYYQSEKFEDAAYKQRIIRAVTPKDAADLGKTKSMPIRQDWERVKIEIMRKALVRKFDTHADARNLLLSTGDRLLIENSPYDNYWGIGRTGAGQNHLGTLLMQVRSLLAPQL